MNATIGAKAPLVHRIFTGHTALLYGLVAVLNVVHPFIHGFEGGGFDVVLIQLDTWLMHLGATIPWHNPDHCEGRDHG